MFFVEPAFLVRPVKVATDTKGGFKLRLAPLTSPLLPATEERRQEFKALFVYCRVLLLLRSTPVWNCREQTLGLEKLHMPTCSGLCYHFMESLALLLKFVKNHVFTTSGGTEPNIW